MIAVLQAPDMKSALARARERCGEDAIVVATRRVGEGVEIEVELRPPAAEDWVSAGGAVAIVGPAGAGKSTLLAAFAAQWVLRHGPRRATLHGVGGERSRAADALARIGRLVGLPVRLHLDVETAVKEMLHAAADGFALLEVPAIVDESAAQATLSVLARRPLRVQLALPATLHRRTADKVIARYQAARPAGIVLTHCAESAAPQEVVAAAEAASLAVDWRLDGPRIPDDLHRVGAPQNDFLSTRKRHVAA